MTGAVLSVSGNVVLRDQAQLTVTGGGLTFPQTDYFQYSISLRNSARLTLNNSSLVTNRTSEYNFSMTLNAYDTSVVNFGSSNLSTTGGSWLLGNFHDQSQLTVNSSTNLPTETYPRDSSNISVANSNAGSIWLVFESGSSATINVPQKDSQGKFNFDFGNSPGFNYSVHMVASHIRLGLNSHPGSTMIVNGNGLAGANDADLVFGYYIENNTGPVTLTGVDVGSNITRQFTDQGRNLSLHNVNLNPFTWQVYVSQSNGFPVTVSNSIVNEIAALTNGLLNISDCVLQLAVTEAGGAGSQMNITGTQIWSQAILAANGGQMNIGTSHFHGNFISAGPGSSITITDSVEDRNATPSTSCTSIDGYPPNTNGVPLCNPFNPLGQCSQVTTKGNGVVTGTPACN